MAASPELQAVIDQMAAVQSMAESPPVPDVETVRMLTDALAQTRTLPDRVTVTPVSVDGVPCEWIYPDGAPTTDRLLYLHGGGYVAGNLDSHRPLCSDISVAAGVAILNVDYRLAPEAKSPAQLEDALTAYRWMLSNGPDGIAEAEHCYIAGDSAGGGLTLATLQAIRGAGLPMPNAAATLSAWADASGSSTSMESNADNDPVVQKGLLDFCASCVVPEGGDIRDPIVSPQFGDFGGLPPLLIQVGENETLLDDSLACAEKAEAAGVAVVLERWAHVFHVWHAMGAAIPESGEAIEHVGKFFRNHR